jgi:hypothetical protein
MFNQSQCSPYVPVYHTVFFFIAIQKLFLVPQNATILMLCIMPKFVCMVMSFRFLLAVHVGLKFMSDGCDGYACKHAGMLWYNHRYYTLRSARYSIYDNYRLELLRMVITCKNSLHAEPGG